MQRVLHKGWDIDLIPTGRTHEGQPVMGLFGQNGLNDIEPDGSFVPCDMTVEEITQGVTHLKVKRGRWGEVRFGDADHPNPFLVKFKDKDLKGVSFKYTGANGSSMTANNGKPLCDFDNGISIESTPTYNGVKMDIIVNNPLTAPLEYPFSIKTYGQDYDFIEENGGATLKGEDQESIFIRPPYAIDDAGDIGPVVIHYTGVVNNLITFKKVVDEAWFRQALAPVKIDPFIVIDGDSATVGDALLSGVPIQQDFNYGGRGDLGAFKASVSNQGTALFYFDISVLSNVTVIDARIGLDIYLKSGTSYATKVFEVLKPWSQGDKNGVTATAGEVTWLSQIFSSNPAWAGGGCQGSGSDHNATEESSVTVTAVNSDVHFALTNATVQEHINTPSSNNGYVFISQDVSFAGAFWFARSSDTGSGNKPYIYIEYTEGAAGRRRRILERGV